MKAYTIKIEPEAHQDIQDAIDWYNQQQAGLGGRFHTEIKATFKKLKTHPFFQIRYDTVHCFLLKRFPYMVHYTIDEENRSIVVRAVFCTSKDPKTGNEETKAGNLSTRRNATFYLFTN